MSISNPFIYTKKSRLLTDGEKQMAFDVFGASLCTKYIYLKTAWWVLKGYAVSPNGNIYFHPDDWCDDFSRVSLLRQAWLVHELTHVWQVQQGVLVFWRALINRRYDYVLEQGKAFACYGVEQQACMVADYYVDKMQGKDCSLWQVCIPFLQIRQADFG